VKSDRSAEEKDPLVAVVKDAQKAFVDLLLFAPIGFVKKAGTVIPDLVREGRATAKSANTIGRFVTPIVRRQGRKFVEERLGSVRQPTSSAHNAAPAAEMTIDVSTRGPVSADEPFAGYDHLGSAAVVARLDELTQEQRDEIRAYELANRNRRTILGRLEQLG
jgi:hypothetical protein